MTKDSSSEQTARWNRIFDLMMDIEGAKPMFEARLAQDRQELLKRIESSLPEKIEEGDGWEIYFTNGKEKGKVRSCCPGDDIAYVQNKTIDSVQAIINAIRESI